MAHFEIKHPDGSTRSFRLFRRLTSIGRGNENDLVLPDRSVAETAIALLFDGKTYNAGGQVPFRINGRLSTAAELVNGDVISIGGTTLTFRDSPSAIMSSPSIPFEDKTAEFDNSQELAITIFKRLSAFSDRLFKSYEIDSILEALVDECLAVSRADKGFLILFESGKPHIKTARNLKKGDIEGAEDLISDSIIAKVLATKEPLIVPDTLAHPDFKVSASVMSLNLLSVISIPLMQRGEVFGLIYLGNDRLVNRFDKRVLDTLTIFAAQASLIIQNALLVNELKLENVSLKSRLNTQSFGDIIGACDGMRQTYSSLSKVAPTDLSILITGETGTGKELIALEIHRRSPRVNGPFISVNCGAIPENLMESEFFGHVKGAFTGAVANKDGRFQAARGGTLFLDEIGELPLNLQVKLLRALQEKTITRVGDPRTETVDVRVVAATNRSLDEELKRGTFREDLFFRINTVTIRLPPLRERGDDIHVLAKYFLSRYSQEFGKNVRGFTPGASQAMKEHDWPGNVRELENRIKRALVMSDKALLGPGDLELEKGKLPPILPLAEAKEEFQRRYIDEVLERNGGNRTKTARDLGVDPRTIFRHLFKNNPSVQDESETNLSETSDDQNQ